MRMTCSAARTVVARKVALSYVITVSTPPTPFHDAQTDVCKVIDVNLLSQRPYNDTPDHQITRSAQYQLPVERGQRHEPGEPEHACQGVEGEYDPFVEEAAVAAAGEDGVEEVVGEGEEGEGSDEDEVGGRGGRFGRVRVVEIPGCY